MQQAAPQQQDHRQHQQEHRDANQQAERATTRRQQRQQRRGNPLQPFDAVAGDRQVEELAQPLRPLATGAQAIKAVGQLGAEGRQQAHQEGEQEWIAEASAATSRVEGPFRRHHPSADRSPEGAGPAQLGASLPGIARRRGRGCSGLLLRAVSRRRAETPSAHPALCSPPSGRVTQKSPLKSLTRKPVAWSLG